MATAKEFKEKIQNKIEGSKKTSYGKHEVVALIKDEYTSLLEEEAENAKR